MNALLEIQNQYSGFSKTNKRIADYILANYEGCLNMTALDIADKCQTSSASIIRFAKTLGFPGLDEFKISLAKATLHEDMYGENMKILESDDSKTLKEKVQSMLNNSNDLFFYQLDLAQYEMAVEALQKARHIYLLGIGASALPAYDMYHKFRRINRNASFEFDAHMMVEFFQFLNEQDVVLAFSYSGQSSEVIYPCEIAKDKGAKVIAVTRNARSPLSDLSDILLTLPNNEHLIRVGAITSKYSSLLMGDLLYLGIIQENYTQIEESLVNTSFLTRKLKIKSKG